VKDRLGEFVNVVGNSDSAESGAMKDERRTTMKRADHKPQEMNDLKRSRVHLQHLIYSMEHDRSLNAETSKIIVLREMLHGIETQIGSRQTL
jgi:hypothetical protein